MKRILAVFLSASIIWTSGGVAQASQASDVFAVASNLPQFQLIPPGQYGRIVDYFNATEAHKPLVILIQDLHAHYGVQKNIAAILEFLADKMPGRIAVAVEGAAGPVDSSIMALYPDEKVKLAAADYLMHEGELTGAEYFAIKHGMPHLLVGAEDEKYYLVNRDLFRKTFQDRNEFIGTLKMLEHDINELPRYVYHKNKAVWEFHQRLEAYNRGELASHEFIGFLTSSPAVTGGSINLKEDFPTLAAFASNSRYGTMDEVRSETAAFLTQTQSQLSGEEKQNLKALAKGRDNGTYYLYLRELVYKHQLFIAAPPELAEYMEYIYIARTRGMERVTHEAKELAFKIEQRLAQGDKQAADLVQVRHDLDLLVRVGNLEATEYEVREFAPRLNQFMALTKALLAHQSFDESNIRRLISSSVDFYVMALMRNKPMVENTLALHRDVSVLVAGGFHTTQLTNLLREKNISYLVMNPLVDHYTEADRDLYVKRLSGQLLTEEEILAQAENRHSILAQSLGLHENRIGPWVRLLPFGEASKSLAIGIKKPAWKALATLITTAALFSHLSLAAEFRPFKNQIAQEGNNPEVAGWLDQHRGPSGEFVLLAQAKPGRGISKGGKGSASTSSSAKEPTAADLSKLLNALSRFFDLTPGTVEKYPYLAAEFKRIRPAINDHLRHSPEVLNGFIEILKGSGSLGQVAKQIQDLQNQIPESENQIKSDYRILSEWKNNPEKANEQLKPKDPAVSPPTQSPSPDQPSAQPQAKNTAGFGNDWQKVFDFVAFFLVGFPLMKGRESGASEQAAIISDLMKRTDPNVEDLNLKKIEDEIEALIGILEGRYARNDRGESLHAKAKALADDITIFLGWTVREERNKPEISNRIFWTRAAFFEEPLKVLKNSPLNSKPQKEIALKTLKTLDQYIYQLQNLTPIEIPSEEFQGNKVLGLNTLIARTERLRSLSVSWANRLIEIIKDVEQVQPDRAAELVGKIKDLVDEAIPPTTSLPPGSPESILANTIRQYLWSDEGVDMPLSALVHLLQEDQPRLREIRNSASNLRNYLSQLIEIKDDPTPELRTNVKANEVYVFLNPPYSSRMRSAARPSAAISLTQPKDPSNPGNAGTGTYHWAYWLGVRGRALQVVGGLGLIFETLVGSNWAFGHTDPMTRIIIAGLWAVLTHIIPMALNKRGPPDWLKAIAPLAIYAFLPALHTIPLIAPVYSLIVALVIISHILYDLHQMGVLAYRDWGQTPSYTRGSWQVILGALMSSPAFALGGRAQQAQLTVPDFVFGALLVVWVTARVINYWRGRPHSASTVPLQTSKSDDPLKNDLDRFNDCVEKLAYLDGDELGKALQKITENELSALRNTALETKTVLSYEKLDPAVLFHLNTALHSHPASAKRFLPLFRITVKGVPLDFGGLDFAEELEATRTYYRSRSQVEELALTDEDRREIESILIRNHVKSLVDSVLTYRIFLWGDDKTVEIFPGIMREVDLTATHEILLAKGEYLRLRRKGIAPLAARLTGMAKKAEMNHHKNLYPQEYEDYTLDLINHIGNQLEQDILKAKVPPPPARGTDATLKEIGIDNGVQIESWKKNQWFEAAADEGLQAITIYNVTIEAKFIWDDQLLPEGILATNLPDADGNPIIITRFRVTRDSQGRPNLTPLQAQIIHHEYREFQRRMEIQEEKGPALTDDAMRKERQLAHLLASADDILVFGQKGLTPFHETEIARIRNLPISDRETLLREDRSWHDEQLVRYFSADQIAALRRHDERFREAIQEGIEADAAAPQTGPESQVEEILKSVLDDQESRLGGLDALLRALSAYDLYLQSQSKEMNFFGPGRLLHDAINERIQAAFKGKSIPVPGMRAFTGPPEANAQGILGLQTYRAMIARLYAERLTRRRTLEHLNAQKRASDLLRFLEVPQNATETLDKLFKSDIASYHHLIDRLMEAYNEKPDEAIDIFREHLRRVPDAAPLLLAYLVKRADEHENEHVLLIQLLSDEAVARKILGLWSSQNEDLYHRTIDLVKGAPSSLADAAHKILHMLNQSSPNDINLAAGDDEPMDHDVVNRYIYKHLPEDLRRTPRHISDFSTVEANKALRIPLIPIKGLFLATGQLAHIGLGTKYKRPVFYIDENYLNEPRVLNHEIYEINRWDERRQQLGKTWDDMRDWITSDLGRSSALANRYHQEAPAVRGVLLEAARRVDEYIQRQAETLQNSNEVPATRVRAARSLLALLTMADGTFRRSAAMALIAPAAHWAATSSSARVVRASEDLLEALNGARATAVTKSRPTDLNLAAGGQPPQITLDDLKVWAAKWVGPGTELGKAVSELTNLGDPENIEDSQISKLNDAITKIETGLEAIQQEAAQGPSIEATVIGLPFRERVRNLLSVVSYYADSREMKIATPEQAAAAKQNIQTIQMWISSLDRLQRLPEMIRGEVDFNNVQAAAQPPEPSNQEIDLTLSRPIDFGELGKETATFFRHVGAAMEQLSSIPADAQHQDIIREAAVEFFRQLSLWYAATTHEEETPKELNLFKDFTRVYFEDARRELSDYVEADVRAGDFSNYVRKAQDRLNGMRNLIPVLRKFPDPSTLPLGAKGFPDFFAIANPGKDTPPGGGELTHPDTYEAGAIYYLSLRYYGSRLFGFMAIVLWMIGRKLPKDYGGDYIRDRLLKKFHLDPSPDVPIKTQLPIELRNRISVYFAPHFEQKHFKDMEHAAGFMQGHRITSFEIGEYRSAHNGALDLSDSEIEDIIRSIQRPGVTATVEASKKGLYEGKRIGLWVGTALVATGATALAAGGVDLRAFTHLNFLVTYVLSMAIAAASVAAIRSLGGLIGRHFAGRRVHQSFNQEQVHNDTFAELTAGQSGSGPSLLGSPLTRFVESLEEAIANLLRMMGKHPLGSLSKREAVISSNAPVDSRWQLVNQPHPYPSARHDIPRGLLQDSVDVRQLPKGAIVFFQAKEGSEYLNFFLGYNDDGSYTLSTNKYRGQLPPYVYKSLGTKILPKELEVLSVNKTTFNLATNAPDHIDKTTYILPFCDPARDKGNTIEQWTQAIITKIMVAYPPGYEPIEKENGPSSGGARSDSKPPVTEQAPDLWDEVSSKPEFDGWVIHHTDFEGIADYGPGARAVKTTFVANNAMGYVNRGYDPDTRTFILLNATIPGNMPWVPTKTNFDPKSSKKGTPSLFYFSLAQMKMLSDEMAKAGQTFDPQNFIVSGTANQQSVLDITKNGRIPPSALKALPSYRYAETIAKEAGFEVVGVPILIGGEARAVSEVFASNPVLMRRVMEENHWTPSTPVWTNFDISFTVQRRSNSIETPALRGQINHSVARNSTPSAGANWLAGLPGVWGYFTTIWAVWGPKVESGWALNHGKPFLESTLGLPPLATALVVGIGIFWAFHLIQLLWNKGDRPWYERTNAFSPEVLLMTVLTVLAALGQMDVQKLTELHQAINILSTSIVFMFTHRQRRMATEQLVMNSASAALAVSGANEHIPSPELGSITQDRSYNLNLTAILSQA